MPTSRDPPHRRAEDRGDACQRDPRPGLHWVSAAGYSRLILGVSGIDTRLPFIDVTRTRLRFQQPTLGSTLVHPSFVPLCARQSAKNDSVQSLRALAVGAGFGGSSRTLSLVPAMGEQACDGIAEEWSGTRTCPRKHPR